MLKNIHPLLSPDLLHTLASMGHGDDIAIVDANFPAESMGKICLRLDGTLATDVLDAVLSLLPIDTFVDDPFRTMAAVGSNEAPEIVGAFQQIINKQADNPALIKPVERFRFYEAAKQAFAVVLTGERRLYGNIILKKGVVQPE